MWLNALVKLGRDFESMTYQGEIHFLCCAIVLRDAVKRADQSVHDNSIERATRWRTTEMTADCDRTSSRR